MGEKLPDWKAAAELVRKIAENYRLPYYTMSPTYSICTEHGYLSGEQYTCPYCGGKTEVYSRITGYYRPVQNWNDGKTQEFKDRKVYNMKTSVLRKKQDPVPKFDTIIKQAMEAPASLSPNGKSMAEAMLFTTKTCPNCKIAARLLDEAHLPYTKMDAEEHPDLVSSYQIMQAPTLVVVDGDRVQAYRNPADIRKYVQEHK